MADFFQNGLITTLHDLGHADLELLEQKLNRATEEFRLGLVLPVTASDMRAEPFGRIVEHLREASYIDTICVVLGVAPNVEDYHETVARVAPLGDKAHIVWTDGGRLNGLFETLETGGFNLGSPGKGRSAWTAFGYLLADPDLKAFVLHDCDIVTYDRMMLARLCLPMAEPGLDFEFCKAYYARLTDRMHGRVVRLLVKPFLRGLISVLGHDPFLEYMDSFRYPLSGEFAVSVQLARSNRIPSDWGLEVGTLSEVFRNTSIKKVCQVDLCREYEHKHQALSLDDPGKGLLKMAGDIVISIYRTLASRGVVMHPGHYVTLRSAYLRAAQDAIRQYHADAVMNGLQFDRHSEEMAVEAFSQTITTAGEAFQTDPVGGQAIPNWARVLAAMPDFPQRLREAAREDREEFSPR